MASRTVKVKGHPKPVPVPTGIISMAGPHDGYLKNGVPLTRKPQNFDVDKLDWSDAQWVEALGDSNITIASGVRVFGETPGAPAAGGKPPEDGKKPEDGK